MNTVLSTNGYIYAGLGDGLMWRCDLNNANACYTFNTLPAAINTLISANAYIYAGLSNGQMWRCDPNTINRCDKFNTLTSPIKSLLRANKYIYAGLENGETWRCDPNSFNACTRFNTLGKSIVGLGATKDYVYATTNKFIAQYDDPHYIGDLWRCNPSTGACSIVPLPTHDDGFEAVAHSLAVAPDGTLYIGDATSGLVYRCAKDSSTSCSVFHSFDGPGWWNIAPPINAMTIANGYLYIGFGAHRFSSADVRTSGRCPLDNPGACEVFFNGDTSGVHQISIPYDTMNLKQASIGEDTSCSVQSDNQKQICLPYVQYLSQEARPALMLTIKNGKLYNSQGVLFDTTYADPSVVPNGGNAAIFVMDIAGKIYASNVHPKTLLRHSSFLAGHPVTAAGELKVEQGVIKALNNCTASYELQPNMDVSAQVLLSLDSQDYTGQPPYTSCPITP